jgi:hypothetical protein
LSRKSPKAVKDRQNPCFPPSFGYRVGKGQDQHFKEHIMWRFSIVLASWGWLLACPLAASAKPEDGKSAKTIAAASAKANQELMQQVSKSGVRGAQLRQLSAALKKDDTLGSTVKAALDKGLRGRDLADFIQTELKNRQEKAAGNAASGSAGGMGNANALQKGMGGQGMMQGTGGQGMGQGMGSGPGACPGGMRGRGMGMMGPSGGMRGPR